jgi:hypothetical protein
MSSSVQERLAELVHQGEVRRSRTHEIQRESRVLREAVQCLRQEPARRALPTATRPTKAAGARPRDSKPEPILDQVRELLGGDVLQQVQSLLGELETREGGRWSEEDTHILLHVRQIWDAARRRGYTLQDLWAVLKGLEPPGPGQ